MNLANNKRQACQEQQWMKNKGSSSSFAHLWYLDEEGKARTVCGVGHSQPDKLEPVSDMAKCTLCGTSAAGKTTGGKKETARPAVDPVSAENPVRVTQPAAAEEASDLAPNDGRDRYVIRVTSGTNSTDYTEALRRYVSFYGKPDYVVCCRSAKTAVVLAVSLVLSKDTPVYTLGGVLRSELWVPTPRQ